MSDTFNFDKFMKKQLPTKKKKENSKVNRPEENPNRKYNRLYQERWQNRIVWGIQSNVKK